MDGAVVEDEVILGAGSLVPPGQNLETGFLYIGSPARKARAPHGQGKEFLRYPQATIVSLRMTTCQSD